MVVARCSRSAKPHIWCESEWKFDPASGAPTGYALRSANGFALRRRANANAGAKGADIGRERGGNIGSELTMQACASIGGIMI